MNQWIWQSKNYPNFVYDEKNLQPLLDDIHQKNKKLNSIISDNQLSTITLELKINSLSNEIINSAAIEGEIFKRESVRSSLRKKLDKDFDRWKDRHSTHQSDNYVALLLDTNLNKNPLSLERLHGWHNCLFEARYKRLQKINIARFREDEMEVVSGAIGHEMVHYQAVLAQDIDKNIEPFLDFCNNSSVNAYIKSAIAHIWFVIIHPYDDGNGRIARAIADFLLPNENIKLYSLSKEINHSRKEYYDILERINKFNESCDISEWVAWHLKITNFALKNGIKELDRMIFKTKFWDTFRDYNLSANQQKFLNKILDIGINDFKGNLNLKKYMVITGTSFDTAKKELDELLRFGCLIKKEDSDTFLLNQDFFQNLSLMDKIEAHSQTQADFNNLIQRIEQAEQNRQRSDENYKNGMNRIHTPKQNDDHLNNETSLLETKINQKIKK
ncbi:DUF4172 domain-containing protein [Helicobacter sp. 14348-15]|uniref:Fic family protein n=1 Tax=Helicobacter colisuis TaxID=2949739 RepID=UPI00202B42D2|nr:DUF4172 domain-containing protein [Helicobacter colisuis]MCL9821824.1 DUF4172 domain-containing protein [Helicobacter colisuis]